MADINFSQMSTMIWNNAEMLRGPYKKERYGDVILPLCVLRRFDCVLAPTKQAVLDRAKSVPYEELLNAAAQQNFHNKSQFDFEKLLNDPNNIAANLRSYIRDYSANVRQIFENFDFDKEIKKMDENNILYSVIKLFSTLDLSPNNVSNAQMGYIFEDLIRRFSENAEAGDHYTPREVIKLMVNLILNGDQAELMKQGKVVQVGDFACGTGGMLSEALEYITQMNPDTTVEVFGQELNPQSYAICCADLLIKGQNANNVKLGNSFTQDGHKDLQVRYALMNPPFGVDWKKDENTIKQESETLGYKGRFGAGTPRTSDGSLLFLQHMISKMKQDEQGSRMAIIFNGSPLFTGDAGGGESNIRKWILENDYLEAIVALPTDLFYNTGIATYIWIITNRKNTNLQNGPIRKNKVQLIDASSFFQKMRKSLGNKRSEITEEHIKQISEIYADFKEGDYCKIFDTTEFGYQKIVVERPLQLNFAITAERIENLYNESAFAKLYSEEDLEEVLAKEKPTQADREKVKKLQEGKLLQEKIIAHLSQYSDNTTIYKNRERFIKALETITKDVKEITPALFKAILSGLSERDETAEVCKDKKGRIEPDSNLRDTENVPLNDDINAYFRAEVEPHVPDAWIDESKTKIGYEIPFTRYFYKYQPLRPLEEIDAEIQSLESEILDLLKGVTR
jgi:type I restriction enzyme M protein